MELIQEYLPALCQALVAVLILATIVAKVTPSTKDDVLVESAKNKFLKLLSWLPTFGVNPRTKALEDALKELQEKKPQA